MWYQLVISELEQDKIEDISEHLESLGALSITYSDLQDNPIFEPALNTTPLWQQTVLTALFNDEDLMQTAKQLVNSSLPYTSITSHTLDDVVWEREWLKSFKPMCFGKRLWICPTHYEPPEPEAVNIMLDPGLAFGTGTHQTTALCLEFLDQADLTDKTICDYGTGSGILAISGLKLGARHAYAVDIDPQSVTATKQNAINNNISFDNLIVGLVEEVDIPKVDLMLANILAGPLVELAPTLVNKIKPGGELVISGLLDNQIEEVTSAYKDLVKTIEIRTKDEWVLFYMTV